MSDQSGAPQPLTNHVTRALAELRGEAGSFTADLSSGEREDMERLFSAGAALDALLGDRSLDEQTRRHDIVNVLGAMRGYAEMLLEELAPRLPKVEGVLQRVLKSVAAASDAG